MLQGLSGERPQHPHPLHWGRHRLRTFYSQRKCINGPVVHPKNVQLHNIQLQNVQLQNVHLPNVQLQNIQVTKRVGYETSRTQNVQFLYNCWKKPFHKIFRNCIVCAGGCDTHVVCGPCMMGFMSMGDAVHGCVLILCRDRSGLVVGTQWAGG